MYVLEIKNIGPNHPEYSDCVSSNPPTIRILTGNGEVFLPPGSTYAGSFNGTVFIEEDKDGRCKS